VRDVRLVGVGSTSFSRAGRDASALSRQAAGAALADAGLSRQDVTGFALATGTCCGAVSHFDAPQPAYSAICTSGAAAVHLGWQAVATGAVDVMLCLGRELAGADGNGRRMLRIQDLAAAADRYMDASGATECHFARVAAKNRANGSANPRALLTAPVDEAAVLESELLAWPLRDPMVALPSEGAAAIVLASSDFDRRAGARAPRVCASALVPNGHDDTLAATVLAAGLTYEAAGLGPEDVDCAEIDDPTVAGELSAYEALQFAPEGEGPELVESGFTALRGVLPVNTSGGALAQGAAPGAAGIAQLCELAWQLRGEAGRRQVPGARVGLALASAIERGRGVLSVTIVASR
jgi:acetyl-CoA acetyltransferase